MESESPQERFERLLEQLEADRVDPWEEQTDGRALDITVAEDEEAYVVEFDMSAYDTETVSARVDDRTLVVTAERFEEGSDEQLSVHVDSSRHQIDSQTRRRYTAREAVAFPVPVSESDVDITVTDDITTVILEKAE